ncbi:MAG: hypothetical protein IKP61_06985 [Spirochaetales bacterium]|nr:hypothetical protein [Spirochaetales bacterium]
MNRKVFILVAVLLILAAAILLVVLSCGTEPEPAEVFNAFIGKDCLSPTLLSVKSESGSIIRLEFDEPVKVFGRSFEPSAARCDGRFVYVSLPKSLPPGQKSTVSGRVKDYSGNTTGFSVSVWGFNPRLPETVINEFSTKGTAKSPSRTELLVLGEGNLNGIVLYCGIPDDYDVCVMLGDIEVKKDDLVVIWWTEALPEDVVPREAGVWNICAQSAQKPSSNNGTLVLCENPSSGSAVMDAVVYSNFSQSHEGFGTRAALLRARWVLASGAWTGDAVDGTSSTATRSVCRFSGRTDSDSDSDWYVTVTSGSTFGAANTSEAFIGN